MVRSAGARDTQVEIQRAVQSVVDGAPTETWETVITLWASVEYRQPRDLVINSTRYDQEVIRARFEWIDGQAITEDSRLVIAGKIYDVIFIDRDTDRRALLMVEAGEFLLDADKALSEWRKLMRRGWIVQLQDRSQNPIRSIKVRAVGEFVKPEELVNGLNQGAKRYQIFGDDIPSDFAVAAGQWVVDRAGRQRIRYVDDVSFRFRDRVVIYEVIVEGNIS